MFTGFWAKAVVLDELKSLSRPTPEEVNLVLQMLGQAEYVRYFFHDLKNPAWLEPLKGAGVFRTPPEPAETEKDSYAVPLWHASRYLIRVAKTDPDPVIEIALQIETENFHVHAHLIQAAMNMPADKAAQMVPAIVNWLDSRFRSLVPNYAIELMVYLAEHDEAETALDLLEVLTAPRVEEISVPTAEEHRRVRREAQPRYERWYLKELIESKLPALSKLDALGVVDILERQLRKSIDIEGRGMAADDGFYMWRPAIEDHPQNWGHGELKDLLTVGLRDALERAMSDAPEQVESIIERYLGDSFSVFRRLALHLIRVGRQRYRKLLPELFEGRRFLDDIAVHHEFSLLMQECFPELPERSKKPFLDMIVAEPPSEGEGKPGLDELHRRWVLRRLWLVREHLMPPYDSLLEYLVDRFGEPEHADFLTWHGPVWVGPTSPKDKSELASMSAREVLEYLWAFVPSGKGFDDSREGLARQLEAVVKHKPEDYVAIAPDFMTRGVHPTYVYHLVRGFHEAWKDDKELDWERVLALCKPISLALTDDGVRLVEAPPELDDISWSGVRAAIARFLAGALRRIDRPLPMEMMPRMRDVLLRFMRDQDPTPEDEQRSAESFMDWVTVRINSARGVTAEALLAYALRYARLHKEEHEARKVAGAHPCRLEPEVKAAFNDMLDKSKEPSVAVHSIFGDRLPSFLYLDHDWTIANLDNIFPSDPEEIRYWEAAWEAYMLYCGRMYTEMYKLLRPQYWRAVRAMARSEVSKVIKRTEHRSAYHLALAYTVELEPLTAVSERRPVGVDKPETEGSLLGAFLASASDEVRATAVRALDSELRPDKPIEDKNWQRLREYWEARTLAAQTAPSERPFDQELSAFSSWLEGVPEGLDELALLLGPTVDHLTLGHEAQQVLAYLSKQSARHPALAVNFLGRLLGREQSQEGIYLFGVEVQIRTILQNALPSDKTGRREAISIINMLGERGEYGYRDLLTDSAVR